MSVSRLAVAAAAFSILAVSANAAPNLVGVWKGKIKLDLSKIPGAQDPAVRAQLELQQTQMSRSTLLLTLSKNKTFNLKVLDAPTPQPPPDQNGTWVLKADKLTLNAAKNPHNPRPFTIAKNGKSFSVEIRQGATLTFTR